MKQIITSALFLMLAGCIVAMEALLTPGCQFCGPGERIDQVILRLGETRIVKHDDINDYGCEEPYSKLAEEREDKMWVVTCVKPEGRPKNFW
jgi:hypothetical protein